MSTGAIPLEGPRHEIDQDDDLYPQSLREVEDRPARLYVIGDPRALHEESVSIVGARKATPYGIACAELAARCAVSMGVSVVSGAAVGCDQAAQREALRLGGRVSAVLGSGADVVYPASARGMLERIVATGGAVVSLQPWGSPAIGWTFIRRNSVIAALSKTLVICEAGMPSGTFSTARFASDAGREVLVFPGSVFSPNSTGSNYLIASDPNVLPVWDHACLEVAYSRVFGRLRHEGGGLERATQAEQVLQGWEQGLLDSLEASPAKPGELAAALCVELPRLMSALSRFELQGRVGRLVDGRYCLSKDELMGHNMGQLKDGTVRR